MISLFLDTSSTNLTLAIFKDKNHLYYSSEKTNNDLSRRVLPKIDEALKLLALNIKNIDRIYVVNGPGSFTGIRVGVTIAKVLAWSLNIKIYTVSSLEVIATTKVETKYLVPLIDARRDHFYAGMYCNGENVIPDCYISRDNLINKIKEITSLDNVSFVSFDEIEIDNLKSPELNILNLLDNRKAVDPHKVNPNYLKKTEAEEKVGK